jgi:polysaccharide pyruvyl transferase WcaK-like protein
MKDKMVKIGITGWYGKHNLGDELLKRNIQKFYKNHTVKVLEPNQIENADIDLLVFGGGAILHDLYITRYHPRKIMDKISCPILMLGVSIPYGNKKTVISHKIDYFIKKIDFLGFRDPISKSIFTNLWNKSSYILPDLGFLTAPKISITKHKVSLQIRKVPKSYRDLIPSNFNKIAKKQFARLYNYFTKLGYDTSFLLFHPSDKNMIPKKSNFIACYDDIDQAINEIACSEFCIGSKLHFNIIALTQNVPVKCYYYIGKIEGVLSSIVNSKRIVYPEKIFPSNIFVPRALNAEEIGRLKTTQSYLRESLNLIIRGDYHLPKFPFTKSVNETYVSTNLHVAPKILKKGHQLLKKLVTF